MLETIDPALQLDAARKVSGECENRQWSLSMGVLRGRGRADLPSVETRGQDQSREGAQVAED